MKETMPEPLVAREEHAGPRSIEELQAIVAEQGYHPEPIFSDSMPGAEFLFLFAGRGEKVGEYALLYPIGDTLAFVRCADADDLMAQVKHLPDVAMTLAKNENRIRQEFRANDRPLMLAFTPEPMNRAERRRRRFGR